MALRPPSLRLPLLLALLACASPAAATLLRPLGLSQLLQRADEVVLARALDSDAREESGRIYTHTRLLVTQRLRGKGPSAGAEITLRQLGGSLGDWSQEIVGTPRLVAGDLYLLFLQRDPAGAPYRYIVGLSQGVWRATEGKTTGEQPADLVLRRSSEGVQYVGDGERAADHYTLRQMLRLFGGEVQ